MPTSSYPEPKKEKKTRRRLRLSCVECTKRRQRCDRVYPCGLCVSRGVAHLCRWENVPVARPTPARPPVVPETGALDTIQQLSARIASLEQTVVTERLRRDPSDVENTISTPSPHSRSLSLPTDCSPRNSVVGLSSGNSSYSSPEPDEVSDPFPKLSDAAYRTVSSLVQQSSAHHGEFLGLGSSLSALYSISSRKHPRHLHVTSSQSSQLFQLLPPGEANQTSLIRLIQAIPPTQQVTALCRMFFRDVNWRFGVPEEWFLRTCCEMDLVLRYHASQVKIDANWLSLLFAVLASAPRPGLEAGKTDGPEQHFTHAVAAARAAESAYQLRPTMSRTSAAQGAVLSCFAAPLLCDHLIARGRVSEGWKLIGNAILSAQSVGLHRDPGRQNSLEEVMNDDEKLLRRRAWWGLFSWERMCTTVLARPAILRNDASDVMLPPAINADGTRNLFNVYQRLLVQLMHLAGEMAEKCFGVRSPTGVDVRNLDRKFEQWESQLPAEFRSDSPNYLDNLPVSEFGSLLAQKHTLWTWYLLCRSKLHLSVLTRGEDTFSDIWGQSISRKQSRELCRNLSSDLIRLQCNASQPEQSTALLGSNWYFPGYFSLTEAAVTLYCVGRPGDSDTLIREAMLVLQQAGNSAMDLGNAARNGSEALGVLIQEVANQSPHDPVLPTEFAVYPATQFLPNVGPSFEWYSSDNLVHYGEGHNLDGILYDDNKSNLIYT